MMIGILQRYLAKRVMVSTLVLLIIVGLISLVIGFLDELREISGEYGFFQAAWHAVLELPYTLNQFFPMLVLLGGLIGLGALATNGELIVMRSSGLSLGDFARVMLGVAIVLAIFNIIFGEIIAPRLHYLADVSKSTLQSNGQAVITGTGVWFHQQNDFIHVGTVINPHHLENVTRYAFDDHHRLLSTGYADHIDYQNGQWIVHHLSRTVLTENQQAKSEYLDQTVWDMKLNPSILNASLIEPEEISLNRLLIFVRHLSKNGSHSTEFQFSFWKRLFQPLTILMMLLLSIPFVFVAPRSTMGWRLLTGVLIGFTFYMFDILVGQLSIIFQFSPIVAALFPIVLFTISGYVVLQRLGR